MSTSIFSHITEEYAHFIKVFLVNCCFTEFCEIVYSHKDCDVTDYKSNLFKYKYDEQIWNEVFNRLYHLLEYYFLITQQNELLSQNIVTNQYSSQKTIIVYNTDMLQEYLDKLFGTYKERDGLDSYIYNVTNNVNEYKKLVEKHRVEMGKRELKNHLVYLVNLYIIYQMGAGLSIMTEDEYRDVDNHTNIMPYFEYIGNKGLSVHEINENNYKYKGERMLDISFQVLENKVFHIIHRKLL